MYLWDLMVTAHSPLTAMSELALKDLYALARERQRSTKVLESAVC